MPSPEYRVTTGILWQAALAFALFDALFVTILVRRITGDILRHMKPVLLATTGVFWFFVWLCMCSFFWQSVYGYLFPDWSRWLIPPVYGLFFALTAFVFWWLALRLPGNPTLNFCLLGGLWGMITHVWGMSRGLIDRPPMLQGVSPLSVAVMPIFEFIFYWCIILTISLILWRLRDRVRRTIDRNTKAI